MPTIAEVTEDRKGFSSAMLSWDGKKFAERYYTSDAIFMAPFLSPLIGNDAVSLFPAGLIAATSMARLEIVPEELEDLSADMFWERGRYTIFVADGSEGEVGKYFCIKKRDPVTGHWQIHRDAISANHPPKASATATSG
ncbi:hypothetical protein HDU93_005976 [Gonapodya sp. JEL0774]|nr:hypothetical protein HDU93_005976 [Gonapodya sp. JEL0774]